MQWNVHLMFLVLRYYLHFKIFLGSCSDPLLSKETFCDGFTVMKLYLINFISESYYSEVGAGLV
jgi:hypothetical protein